MRRQAGRTNVPKSLLCTVFHKKTFPSLLPASPPFAAESAVFSFFEDLSSVFPIRDRCCFPSIGMRAPAIFAFVFFASPSGGIYFFTAFSKRACHKQRSICCFFAEDFPARRFPPNGCSHFAAVFGIWFMPFHKNKAADACGLLFPRLRLSSYRSNCRAYSHRWNTG